MIKMTGKNYGMGWDGMGWDGMGWTAGTGVVAALNEFRLGLMKKIECEKVRVGRANKVNFTTKLDFKFRADTPFYGCLVQIYVRTGQKRR